MVEFTNRKLKEFPNHIITKSNDYEMAKKATASASAMRIPELKWNIVEVNGKERYAHIKLIDNAI